MTVAELFVLVLPLRMRRLASRSLESNANSRNKKKDQGMDEHHCQTESISRLKIGCDPIGMWERLFNRLLPPVDRYRKPCNPLRKNGPIGRRR